MGWFLVGRLPIGAASDGISEIRSSGTLGSAVTGASSAPPRLAERWGRC